MDYNNFNHYAKERMANLRGENTRVEPWSHFASHLGAKTTLVARLASFLKGLIVQPKALRRSRS
jgi:hypothetical protein